MIYSSKKYKYVIIDSKLDDSKELQLLLSKYNNFHCVGIAKSKEDGLNLILDQLPHLVFFDTELDDGVTKVSSFGMINELYPYLNSLPDFIAMNASTAHSYEAIKNGVFDYLLKIITPNIKSYQLFLKNKLSVLESVANVQSNFVMSAVKDNSTLNIVL